MNFWLGNGKLYSGNGKLYSGHGCTQSSIIAGIIPQRCRTEKRVYRSDYMSSTHAGRRVLPSLVALRAFEAGARLGSFTRAAEELLITQSAVSRHVRNLES